MPLVQQNCLQEIQDLHLGTSQATVPYLSHSLAVSRYNLQHIENYCLPASPCWELISLAWSMTIGPVGISCIVKVLKI